MPEHSACVSGLQDRCSEMMQVYESMKNNGSTIEVSTYQRILVEKVCSSRGPLSTNLAGPVQELLGGNEVSTAQLDQLVSELMLVDKNRKQPPSST